MTVEDHQAAVSSVRAAVSELLQDQVLKAWCTRKTIARFLQARKWDINDATKQLRSTLEWRKAYQPDNITWDEVSEEAESGKQFILPSKDRSGQPVIVIRPRCEKILSTHSAAAHFRLLVYTMEVASRMADRAGSGKMTWLVDFAGCSIHRDLPLKVRRQTINLLQDHYPERLGLLIGFQPPRHFPLIFKIKCISWDSMHGSLSGMIGAAGSQMMGPFIDPVTRAKIHFVSGKQSATVLAEHFNMDQLETCFGGRSQWQFNPDSYGAKMKQEEFLMQSLAEAYQSGDRLSSLAA